MNLTMLLDMAVEGFGDREILGRRADGMTAQVLRDASARGSAMVKAADADSIVYLAVNGPAFPVAMFAGAYAGVPVIPLNYRLGEEQLSALLRNHPEALAIVDESVTLDVQARRRLSPAEWLASTVGGTTEVSAEPVHTDSAAVMIYTSGTTSAPKGVLLRHEHLVAYVLGSVEFGSAAPSHAALMSVPSYHIAAVANVLTSLYAGRRLIVLEQFEPSHWLDTVRGEGVTNALVVPTMLSRILECGADMLVPSLKSLAYGGAPMPSSVIASALDVWGHVDFVNAYGLTETSSTVAVLSAEDHRLARASTDPTVRARLGSVGRALPGLEIVIRDFAGEALPPGVPGRICVRGAQVSAEYAGAGSVLDEDGFFDTRDEGFLDEDGYLFVGGRTDDTIIRGAENIAPAEIEDVLLRHPAVVDAAVVGVPDEEWGNRVVAAVVLRSGYDSTVDGIRGFVRSALRSSKTPDEIVFVRDLPRTETGKLLRRQVLKGFLEPVANAPM